MGPGLRTGEDPGCWMVWVCEEEEEEEQQQEEEDMESIPILRRAAQILHWGGDPLWEDLASPQ